MNRKSLLKRNYLVTFSDFKIWLDNKIMENIKIEFVKKFHYPTKKLNQSYTNKNEILLIK